jgi:hypothetical protein
MIDARWPDDKVGQHDTQKLSNSLLTVNQRGLVFLNSISQPVGSRVESGEKFEELCNRLAIVNRRGPKRWLSSISKIVTNNLTIDLYNDLKGNASTSLDASDPNLKFEEIYTRGGWVTLGLIRPGSSRRIRCETILAIGQESA